MIKAKIKDMRDDPAKLLRRMLLSRTTKRYIGYMDTSDGTPTYHEWDKLEDAHKWLEWSMREHPHMNPTLIDRRNPSVPIGQRNNAIDECMDERGRIQPAVTFAERPPFLN